MSLTDTTLQDQETTVTEDAVGEDALTEGVKGDKREGRETEVTVLRSCDFEFDLWCKYISDLCG